MPAMRGSSAARRRAPARRRTAAPSGLPVSDGRCATSSPLRFHLPDAALWPFIRGLPRGCEIVLYPTKFLYKFGELGLNCRNPSAGRRLFAGSKKRRRRMRSRLAHVTSPFRAFGLLLGLSAALATGAMDAPAAAQDKPIHLKLSHWVPPSHPLQKALEDWGSSIQK